MSGILQLLLAGGPTILLNNHSQLAGPGSSARFRLVNTGLAEGSDTGGSSWTSYAPEWLTGGLSANYEVEAVVTSGTLTSGPEGVGVWTALSSTVTWIRNTPGAGSQTVIFTLSIRRIGTTQVLDTGEITLTGEN